jgi:hypothetical protein
MVSEGDIKEKRDQTHFEAWSAGTVKRRFMSGQC